MSYRSAEKLLPPELLAEIQRYVDGGYIYIPRRAGSRHAWGSATRAKADYEARNRAIFAEYRSGCPSERLAEKYYLSEKSIQRIIRRMKDGPERPREEGVHMRCLILMGSPRIHGNTAELAKPVMDELRGRGAQVKYIALAEKSIAPCRGCYACQDVSGAYGCVQKDDMDEIVEEIVRADVIILATPIYSWYCPTAMKSVLDRHYGLNKFYGSAEGSLWAGKKAAILATHGYDREYALSPFETGVQRLCEHSDLTYLGSYSVQDTDNLTSFQTEEAVAGARAFARMIMEKAGALIEETE